MVVATVFPAAVIMLIFAPGIKAPVGSAICPRRVPVVSAADDWGAGGEVCTDAGAWAVKMTDGTSAVKTHRRRIGRIFEYTYSSLVSKAINLSGVLAGKKCVYCAAASAPPLPMLQLDSRFWAAGASSRGSTPASRVIAVTSVEPSVETTMTASPFFKSAN